VISRPTDGDSRTVPPPGPDRDGGVILFGARWWWCARGESRQSARERNVRTDEDARTGRGDGARGVGEELESSRSITDRWDARRRGRDASERAVEAERVHGSDRCGRGVGATRGRRGGARGDGERDDEIDGGESEREEIVGGEGVE